MRNRGLRLAGLIFISAVLVTGCIKKPRTEELSAGVSGTETVPEDIAAPEGTDVSVEDLGAQAGRRSGAYAVLEKDPGLTEKAEKTGRLYTIYFDFDTYSIRPSEKEHLNLNGEWLRINPGIRLVIEGHADERGETEYNLALGDKRAMSIVAYLKRMGIKDERLSSVSYGEERPADPGHDEHAWAMNRRAEFRLR